MWIALLIVVGVYGSAFYVLPKHVFWAADEGAKYIQLETLRGWQSESRYTLAYPGANLDSAYHFYPQHPIFPQPVAEGRVRFHWPIWFPLLSILPFKLLGVPGLYGLPLLSGLLTALWSGRLAGRFAPAAAPPTLLLVGLASPIFIYSLLFWEHTLTTFIALAALSAALDWHHPASARRWMKRGLVLALLFGAIALRLEMVAYALALTMALLLASTLHRLPDLRPLFGKIGWLLVILAILVGSILTLTGGDASFFTHQAFLGPRLSQLIETGLYFGQNTQFWANLPDHLRVVWINSAASGGPDVAPVWEWLGLGGLLLGGLSLVGPRRWQLGLLSGAALLLGGVSLYILLLPDRYRTVHSLFLTAPYLLGLFLFINHARRQHRFETTLVAATVMGYLILGTLAVSLRQAGLLANVEWGTRYLLTLYPLGGVAALVGTYHLYQSLSGWPRRFLLALALFLASLGLGYAGRGYQEIRTTKTDLLPYAAALEIIEPPLVTDLIWLPAVLGTQFVEREIYVLPERAALYEWLEAAEGRVDSFVFAGFFQLTAGFLAESPVPTEIGRSEQVKGITFTEVKLTGATTEGEP